MDLTELPQLVANLERVYLDAGTCLELDYSVLSDGVELGAVVQVVGSTVKEWCYGSIEGVRSSSLQLRVQRELSGLFGRPMPFVVSGLMRAYARIIREAKASVGKRVVTRVSV